MSSRELVLNVGHLRLFTGDTISKTRNDGTQLLMKVVALTEEANETIVFKREDGLYEHVSIEGTVQMFKDGIYTLIDIPVYHVNQRFSNKYNQESVQILNISPSRDQVSEDFQYFVEKTTTTDGITYHLMSEADITTHYLSEGVETNG